MKRIVSLIALLGTFILGCAQHPEGYYQDAEGCKGADLKTALFTVIDEHEVRTYKELWTDMQSTDAREDGSLWDMYSSTTHYTFIEDQCGNFTQEGSCYNREHSFPKSWFHDDESSPMYTDLFHLYPVDGWVNNMRSNLPFGETANPSKTSGEGYSKVGPSCISGYSKKVFEPADEYKGDFARTYFYMATRYEDEIATWTSDMLGGDRYQAFTPWALEMLLRWSKEDPVSEKETKRNDAVYAIQGNRNPYIDFPGLEQYVWGTKTSTPFDPQNYVNGWEGSEDEDDEGETPVIPDDGDGENGDDADGLQLYRKVSHQDALESGRYYLIVCEDYQRAAGAQGNNIRTYADITFSEDGSVSSNVNSEGMPYEFRLGGNETGYTLYDTTTQTYLALTSNDNKLHLLQDTSTDQAWWSITVSESHTLITSRAYPDRSIQYNTSAPRFACYKGTQQDVSLYVNIDGLDDIPTVTGHEANGMRIYSMDGKPVRDDIRCKSDLKDLKPGIYIIGTTKCLIR